MATEANIPQDEPAKHNTGLEDRDLMIEQFDSISNESSREGSVKPSYGLNQFPQGFECSSEAEKADIIGEQTKNVNSAELSSPDKAPTEDIRKSGHCQADAIKNQELTHICENENLQSKNIETGADKNEVIDGINVEEEHVHEKVKDAAQVSRLGGEDERVTESSIKTEDIDNNNTKYAEDQNEEITLKSGQNEKKEMPSVQEVERKAPESVMSSNKSEHCYEEHELMHDSNEDASAVNVEESPYKHSLEEATSETTSKNGASTGVALEAGEIMNHASFKDCQEKNKDNESIWQEKYVPAIGGKDITEKSTWLNRDEGEAKEDEFNQIGFSETIENSKLTPENAEKSTEQVRHLIEKYEEEEKDKPTSIIDSVETSLPAEKTQLLESTTKNESDVDSKCPLVEKTEQAESGETCEVSQTEQTCAENENQAKDQSEEEITENMVITHANSEGMVTMEITPKPGEGNELDEVPKTLTETRVEIVDGRKVIPEAKEGDAADDMQLHKTAIESEPENEATLRSPSTEFIRDEAIEQGFQEESTKDAELTLATDNESPTQESIKDVEINTKVDETFDEHKSTDREKTLDVTSEGSSADASGVPDNTTGMVVVDDSKKNEAENQEEGEQSHTENSVSKSQEKENTPRTLSSASGIETGKEHPEEDEETKEQIVAAYSTERKISSISDDFMEPKENLGDLTTEENKNNLVENSKCTSGVFEKDDCTTNDFETNFLKDASEGNTSMKEVRPINEDPLKTSDAAPENRNIETIETKAISLDNVDIDEKQEEEVISEENRNIKVADVADEGGQEMSHDIKEKAQITIIEHENEVTVSIPDKTPATVDPSYVDSETSFIVHSKRDSMLVSSDNEHLNADEGTQKHPEEDLVTLKAQNNISGREETEQWKGEQFSSLTDENDTSKLVIAKEKSIVDVSNNIDDVSCNEKPELEEEEHVEKSEANSAVVGVEREAAEQTKIGSSITEEEPDETKDDEIKDENEASHLEIVEEESTVEVPKHIEDVSCMDSKKAEQKNEELVEKAEANSAVVGVEREAAQLTEVGSSSTKEEHADTKDVELAYKNAATELEIVKEEKSTVEMLKHAQDIPSHSLEDEKADQEDEELVEKSEANSSVGVETEATELKARSSNTEEEPAETKDDELEDENETSHLEIVEEESTVEVPKHIEDVPCLDKEKTELENEELVKKAEANSAAVAEEREEAQLTEIGSSSAKEELADTKETELADKNAATELEIVKEEKSTVEILKHIEDVPSHSLDDEKADLEDGKLVEKSEANSSVGVEREAAELKAESSITEEEPAETKDAELEDENETSHLEIVAEESTVEVPKHIEEVSSMDSKNAELKNEELVKKVEANSPVVEAEREAAEVTDVGSSSTKEELADTKNTELADKNAVIEWEIVKEKSTVEMLKHVEDVPSHSLEDEKADQEDVELVEKSEANSSVRVETGEAELKAGSSITEEEPAETKDDELEDENETSHLEIVAEESTIEVSKHIEEVSSMESKNAELKNEELVKKVEANSPVVEAEREAAEVTDVGSSSTKEELADTKNAELADKNAASELEIVKEEKSTVEMLKHIEDVPSYSLDDEKADLEGGELVEKSEANSSVGVETGAAELRAGSSITEEEPAETKDDELEDENETSHLEIVAEESTVEVPKYIEEVSSMDSKNAELKNEELVEKVEANSPVVEAEREAAEVTDVGSSSTKEELADTKNAELADKSAASELEIVKEEKSTVEMLKHIEDVPSHSLDDEKADLEGGELVEKSEANSSVGVETGAAELRAGSSITEEEPAETKDDELEDENETSHLEIVAEESTVEVPKHIEEVSSMDSKNAELKNEELVEKVEANSPVVEAEREAAEVTNVGSSSTKEELADTKNAELADKNAATELEIVKEEKSTVEMLKHIEDVPSQSLDDEKADLEGGELVEKSEANSSVGVETGAAELRAGSFITEEEPAETKDDELEDENETSHLEIVAEESTVEVPKHIEEVSCMDGKNAELKNEELIEKVEANSPVVEAEREAAEVNDVGSSSTKEELADTKNAELADKNAATELEIVKEEKSTVENLKHIEDVPSHSLDDEKADLVGGELVEKSEANSSVGVETGADELKAVSFFTEEEPAETKDHKLEDENETSHLEIVAEESTVEVPKHIEDVSSMDSKNAELKNEALVEKVEADSPVVEAEREAAELTKVGSSSTKEERADTKNAELADKNAAIELEIVKEEKSTVENLKHIEDVPSHSLDDVKADLKGGELVEKSEANSSVGVETEAEQLKPGSSINEEEPAETKYDELEDENEASHLEIVEEESTVEVPKHIEEVSSMNKEKFEQENEELVEKAEDNSVVVGAEREAAEPTEVGSSSIEEEFADTKNAELEIVKEDKSTVEVLKPTEDVPSHSLDDEKTDLEDEECVENYEANSSVGVEREATELKASSITEEEPGETKDDDLEDENETSHLKIVEVPKHIEDVSCMDKEKTELENEELVEKAEANSGVAGVEREAAEQIEVGSSSTEEEPAETKNAALADKSAAFKLEIVKEEMPTVEVLKHVEDFSSYSLDNEEDKMEDGELVGKKKDVSCVDKGKTELEDVELVKKAEVNSAVAVVEREATELEAVSSSTEEELANSKNNDLLIEKADRTNENSPCESDHTVDSPEKILDMSQQKKEKSLLGENGNSTPEGASIDDHHEHANSASVGEDIGEESGLVSKDHENVEENKAENPEVLMTDNASQATGEEIIKACESSKSEASVPKSQEEIENPVGTLFSASVGKEKGKEYPNDDKNEDTKTTEEVQVTSSESKEEIEETCVENFSEISSIEHSKGASTLGSSENEKENSDEGNQKHQDEHEALPSELKTETNISDAEETEQKTPLTDENEASKLEIVKDGKLTVQVSKHNEDVSCKDVEKAKLEDDLLIEKSEGNSVIVAVEREASELKAGSSSTEEPVDTKNDELADRNVASKLEFVEHESPIEVPRHIEDASCVDNKKTELENEDLVEKVEGNLVTAAVERDAAELIAGSSSIEEEPADTKNGELVDRNDASDLEIVEDESTAEVPKHIEDASCTENEKAELDELADKNEAPDLEIVEDESTAEVPKHIEDAPCAENEKTEQENEDLAEKVEGISAVVEVERETSELKAAIYSTEEEPTEPKSDEVADGDDAPKLEIVEDESTTGVPKHAEDVSCMDNEKIELVNEDLVEKVEGNSAIVTEEREEAELRISDTKEEPADPKTDKVADGNDASKLEIVEDESTIGVPKHVEDASCVDNEKVELENEDLVEKFEGKSAIVAVERKAAELKAGISSTEEEPVDPKSDELADGNDAPKLEIVEYESTIEVPKHMEDALCVENEDLVEKVEGNLAIFAAEREAAKLQAESSSTNEEPTNPKSDKLADRNDASKVEIVEDESTIEVPKHAEDASCMDDEKIELENEDLIEKIEGNPAVVAVKRDTTELKAGSSRNEEEPFETNVDELLRKEADGKDEDTHTKSDHNMGSTEKILSMLVQRKEESHVPGGASLEDQDECTHSISVVDDEKSGLAEGKDQDAEITLKCEEQLKQTPQNDGKEILEELPNMISEGSKAEASTEYPENTNTAEEPTATRLEKFSQMKSEAENQETFNDLQSNRTDENIPCESNENVEGAAEILVTSLKTKDKSLSEEHNNPTPREDSIEVQDEYANSVSAAKHNDEEDSKQLLQNDGKETLEELPDGIFAGKVADASGEYPKNTICTTAEETTARLERTSQKENIEGNVKDTEAENQEVLVTTGTIQADRENMIKVFESSNTEDSVSKPQEIENTVRTLPSAPMETEPRKECPEEDESEETKMKEEVKVTITQAKEQIEEAYSAEEKVSNISDDFLEPKEVQGDWSTEENKNNLDGNSSSISGVFDKEQLETSDPTTENKHVTDIETKANSLDSVNIDEKQEEETVSEETRDLKVAEVEDESGQRMYCDIKDKALITGINHEKEVTISTAILDDQSVHTFIDSSALPAYEEPKTKDKTPEIDRTIYVDSETCFIGHSKGDSLLESSDNKKENADEGIQKPRDEDLDVSSERITENNDDREKWKTEQVSGLADRHDNCNLENVNDEGSTVEVLKHIEVVTCLNSEKSVPEDEELVEESKDSSTVLELETEAAEKVASPNAEEESASTKNGELPIEKVHYNVETADNNENTKELLTGIRTIPVGEETGNKVEVSSSGFKEQTEATELTVEKESVTKASHTEQHKEIIDFGASTSTDASKSCSEHSSSTSKVYEEQAEAEVSKIDKGVIDDAKIDSVTVVIEETDLKKVKQVNEENNKGSDIASDNYSLTTTAAEETTLDSKDLDERQEENSSLKKPFLDEANEGHLKMDCCVEEADKTTAIQHEREVATSSIHMSIEEKDTMTAAKINTTETADETAETHLQARENNLQQKEHEVGKPAGGTQLEGVDIKMECSNDNIIKQENENLHMLSHENTKATSTCKEGEVTQGQEILAHEDSEKFSSSSNFIAPEKLPAESSKIERNELPEEKILEPAHLDTKLKSSSDSEANNQTNEQLPQIKEKRDNIQDWISVSVEHIPGQTSMTNLITKEVHSGVDEAGGSENIEEHTRDSEDNLTELQILSARDTNVYQVKDQAFTSTENSKATESSEQKVKVGLTIEDDPTKKEAAAEVLKLESRTRQAESDLVSEIHENVPQMPLEPIEETIAEVQPKNAEPIRATGINAGVEETEVREEKFELPEEPPQAAANLDEEAKIGHEKDDKRGDECREMDPVSGSKDTDVKVAHKKSHSILSGVGSKVKHSISKVKKAITGKSSHPKSQSPKQTKQ